MRRLALIVVSTLILAACTLAGGNQGYELSGSALISPLPTPLSDVTTMRVNTAIRGDVGVDIRVVQMPAGVPEPLMTPAQDGVGWVVLFYAPGVYVFEFTAFSGGERATDTLSVTIVDS